MDAPETAPEPAEADRPGVLDRLVGDETAQLKTAVVCLAGFVVFAAAGGFCWGHLPVALGCWLAAGALLLSAVFLGWQPNEPTTITYYEGERPSGPALPGTNGPMPPPPTSLGRRAG